MTNKYDCFFESIKDFVIRLDLVNEILEEKDLNSDNIFQLEKISKSIRSYLKYFGKDVEFKNNGIGNALFNFASISTCFKLLEHSNIKDELFKVKTIGGWEERVVNFENSELLFLKYDTLSSSYLFVINSVENPVLYVYWGGGEVTSDNIDFVSFMRDTVFWELLRQVNNPSNQMNSSICKIGWIKFYEFLFKNSKNIRNKIIVWRNEFSHISLNEQEANQLWGVDQYEVNFIKFILEKKKVNYDSSYFNPYLFHETFDNYLL